MVKINISDDTACNLFRDMLADDYRRLSRDIAAARAAAGLDEVDHGDLKDWLRWHAAMGQLIDYYFNEDEERELRAHG